MKNKRETFMATVKLGPKGQIVIPKEAREMFGLEPGDSLLLMADSRRGIALQRASVMSKIAEAIMAGHGKDIYPEEPEENARAFADEIQKNVEETE